MSRSGWPRIASGRTSVAGDHDGPRRHGSSLCAARMSPRTARAQLDPSTVGAFPSAARLSPRPARGGGLDRLEGAGQRQRPVGPLRRRVGHIRPFGHGQGILQGRHEHGRRGLSQALMRAEHHLIDLRRCLGGPSSPGAAGGSPAGPRYWGAGPAPAAFGGPRHSTAPQWWADHGS